MNNNEAVQSAAEASIPQTGSNMGGEIIHDREFEKEVAEFISEHLPAKVYNAHFHITRGIDTSTEETILKGTGEQPVSGGSDAPFSDFLSFTSANIGSGRFESGLVLPKPGFLGAYRNPRFIADENAYNIALAEKHGLDAGLLVTPQCDPAESMSLLDGHTCIKALKPYWSYSVGKNLYESDILEYAPEWIWQCAHERGMPVVLHLSHTLNQLSDQGNISQLHYISSKYPRAKIVLAHSATGYNSLKSRKGLETSWTSSPRSALSTVSRSRYTPREQSSAASFLWAAAATALQRKTQTTPLRAAIPRHMNGSSRWRAAT